jgi:hypothetical protein
MLASAPGAAASAPVAVMNDVLSEMQVGTSGGCERPHLGWRHRGLPPFALDLRLPHCKAHSVIHSSAPQTPKPQPQRRGVSRNALLVALQKLGSDLPLAAVRMLRRARARGVDAKVISDCNATFVRHVLAGARLQGCVEEVIADGAAFRRVATAADDVVGIGAAGPPGSPSGGADAAAAPPPLRELSSASSEDEEPFDPAAAAAAGGGGGGFAATAPRRSSSQKLVVIPRRSPAAAPCPRCPSGFCTGAEVAAIRAAAGYRRVVYAAGGMSHVCGVCTLGPGDVVLARAGLPLAGYATAAAGGGAAPAVGAEVHTWRDHEELTALVEKFTASR